MKYRLVFIILSILTNYAVTQHKTSVDSTNTKITEIDSTLKKNTTVTKRFLKEHELWDELLQKHVSNDGKVNYKSFKTEHKKLLDYIYCLSLMHKSKYFESFSKTKKIAFWINVYNALTIDLILRNYPLESIKDIKDPWKQRLWKLADLDYNLDEIEHNILRKMNEPRIHFAIVCASESCPKLQNTAFTAEILEEQLTKATQEFLADTSKNEISENEIKLSKIFRWFKKDFEQDGSLIEFLNKYTAIEISDKAKKSFKDYSWDLND
ncbi:DUF547 domain-containing protein [Winogradskyella marincola]|uniref:DUF547 domain-containing protein n=1 Tax=Winogradskyella marincola TaxID=3037795 RepID=A0ABT6FYK3_9FLAO|nr:DUF547 domain-containing protein [Winogradskyella sp. YYF002]MDG4714861.1 DUF547 domain-containing protein [Winogradskyella sp. YYF002]